MAEKKPRTSGSGMTHGWIVEARLGCGPPREFGGVVLDTHWRQLSFKKSPIGVPNGPGFYQPWLDLAGAYHYESAQALRWWAHAQAECDFGGVSVALETRLVRLDIVHSYSVTRFGHREENGFDDRRWVGNDDQLTPSDDHID